MCGIIAIIAKEKNVLPLLLEGLEKLEYRGYDSAGVGFIQKGEVTVIKSVGKLQCLKTQLALTHSTSYLGIGHTRWATHGDITEGNAHPIKAGRVALVHNGIVENYLELRNFLKHFNIRCETETDTEVIPQLLNLYIEQGKSIEEAVYNTINKLEGTFALAALIESDTIICAKRGKNLVLGYLNGEIYLASDAYTLSLFVTQIVNLEDDDYAIFTDEKVLIFNKGLVVERKETLISKRYFNPYGYFGFKHILLQEIFEQPNVIKETLANFQTKTLDELTLRLEEVTTITIIACGSSYFAGYIAKYWLENLTDIRVYVEIASEFKYRNNNLLTQELTIFISQSGETADTYAALKFLKEKNQHYISIVNTPESSIARASKTVIYTQAGIELSVAATKTFISQLLVLLCLTATLANKKHIPNNITEILENISYYIENTLQRGAKFLEKAVQVISAAHSVIYIGRGISYGVALEGALKLKELSYIHAEALPAGELKHGPIALVSENIPIVAIAPFDEVFKKTLSNIMEIKARKGKIIILTDSKGVASLMELSCLANITIIEMPCAPSFITPIIYTIPLQLLAYYVAVEKGNDVDRPRNLAKSVTVE